MVVYAFWRPDLPGTSLARCESLNNCNENAPDEPVR